MAINQRPNAVAFLDLQGTKDLALTNPNQARNTLREFIDLLAQAVKFYTSRTTRAYLFSDSVFFETPIDHVDQLFNVLRVLRQKLFYSQVYFKCSVTVGRLEAQTPKQANPLLQQVNGFVFGAGAVGAYLLHERLRGIGTIVDVAGFSDQLNKSAFADIQKLTTGCAFVEENKQKSGRIEVTGYQDLTWGLSDDDAAGSDDHVFDNLVKNMIRSSLTSPHVAKKFISPIILMTKCAEYDDLAQLFAEKKEAIDTDTKSSPPFVAHVYKRLFAEKVLERCSDVPGIHLIYLVFLSKILATRKLQRNHETWVRRVMGIKGCQRLIMDKNAPPEALDVGARQQIVEQWARLA